MTTKLPLSPGRDFRLRVRATSWVGLIEAHLIGTSVSGRWTYLMFNANGYTSEFGDGVWCLLDQDGVAIAYGVTAAEAWDQLDGGPVPNDECTGGWFIEPLRA